MDTRTLGTDGPSLSVVGLGGNNFGMLVDADATRAVVHAALDAGITHFDTAEMYGSGHSEEYIGKALAGRRDEVVIATKYVPRREGEPWEPGRLAQRIREGCEISLRRLGTDHIDLYYQHFPDPTAPVSEALETFDALVHDGKVVHIASSNFSGAQIVDADVVATEHSWTRYCGTQIPWNLLQRGVEDDIVPAARKSGVGIVPYFPLASGMLTGKYVKGEAFPEGTRFAANEWFSRGATDENFDRVQALGEVARERGHSLLELAIAWLAAQDGVASVIAGATSPAQVAANAAAAAWTLTDDDLAAVAAVL
jgi:aryl-alcohol dehydrogenase-like predicted oxidoreductase